jgi:ADP-ribosylglycohydrolase
MEPDYTNLLKSLINSLSDKPSYKLNKYAGLMYGLAIADRIALHYENYRHENLIDKEISVIKARYNMFESGDWSEETDMTLLVLDSLIENRGVFYPDVYAENLKYWAKNGFLELNDTIGGSADPLTMACLNAPNYVNDPINVAERVYKQLGGNRAPNNSLVRVCSVLFAKNAVEAWKLQAYCTTADSRCLFACKVVYDVCNSYVNDQPIQIEDVLNSNVKLLDKKHLQEYDKYLKLYIENDLKFLELDDPDNTQYVLKTLGCVVYAVKQIESGVNDYKQIITEVIKFGGDTDANASVVGCVLGAKIGYLGLPEDWVKSLMFRDFLNKKIVRAFVKKFNHV